MLVIPPPPHIKVASNTRPGSKLGATTLNGREKGGQYYISQTCDQEGFEARPFLRLLFRTPQDVTLAKRILSLDYKNC